jgi:hypothetical protein
LHTAHIFIHQSTDSFPSFVLPIALGTAFFYWNPTVFTGNTVNYGEFVNPIITTQKQDNLVLAGLRLGLKNRQVGEKWVSDDCSYLCKGLTVLIKIKKSWCLTNNIMTIEQVSDTLLLNR